MNFFVSRFDEKSKFTHLTCACVVSLLFYAHFLNIQCVPLVCGEELFYAESLKTFVADLNRCRPTLFLSVPRLWTKFQAGIFVKMPEKKLNFLLKIPLINMLVKKKILKGLGLDCARMAGSGSAPLPKELLEWYRKLG